ncbi:MAG: DMT family transporter [Phycisphaerales bacterium]|nr:DMT family transporter [Phycisphaerales bacterium]
MNHPVGQVSALLCAIVWAAALVLFKQSGRHVPPLALNLFKNTVGLVLLAVSVPIELALRGQTLADLAAIGWPDHALLILSGVIGLAIADTIFFRALNVIGVGLVVIVDCSYTPFVVLSAWMLLSERLEPLHYLGAALVVGSLLLVARHKAPEGRTRGQVLAGVGLATLAMACMAVAITAVKPILESTPLTWATAVRLAGGNLFLLLYALLGRGWRENFAVFRPSPAWRYALPGAILGTYVSLVLWVAGFKYTHATVAAVLNQTSVIFASVLAAIFLREHFGGRKVTALVIAFGGVLLVVLAEPLMLWLRAAWPAGG